MSDYKNGVYVFITDERQGNIRHNRFPYGYVICKNGNYIDGSIYGGKDMSSIKDIVLDIIKIN